MSEFYVTYANGTTRRITDVFLDLKDGWLIFRETANFGPERMRINQKHVLSVEKVAELA